MQNEMKPKNVIQGPRVSVASEYTLCAVHEPVSNRLSSERSNILLTNSTVAAGVAYSKLNIWADQILTRRTMFMHTYFDITDTLL